MARGVGMVRAYRCVCVFQVAGAGVVEGVVAVRGICVSQVRVPEGTGGWIKNTDLREALQRNSR